VIIGLEDPPLNDLSVLILIYLLLRQARRTPAHRRNSTPELIGRRTHCLLYALQALQDEPLGADKKRWRGMS
jgi:hypothetical protein